MTQDGDGGTYAVLPAVPGEEISALWEGEKMPRFLIIDDHPMFREALHSAIGLVWPDAETLEASSLAEAIDMLKTRPSMFDLALLDLNIPGTEGYFGLLELRVQFPRLPILIVSGHEDPRIIRDVVNYGAAGFVPKSARRGELTNAMRRVMNGETYLPDNYIEPEDDRSDAAERAALMEKLATLTPQQLRVMNMLRNGLLNKQIAYELKVGETTVKAHVSEVLRKIGVYSRTQVVIELSRLDADDLLKLERKFTAT